MKCLIAVLLFFSLHLISYCQDSLSASGSGKVLTAYIQGHDKKGVVDIDFIKKGFRLILSDTSYKIKQLYICWNSENGNINCLSRTRDSVIAEELNKKPNNIYVGSLLTIENIYVTRNSERYHLPSLVFQVEDIYKKYPTIKDPQICHNKKNQVHCYNDGSYIIHFNKNRIAGFLTADSFLSYDEPNKEFRINNIDSNGLNNVITIKLNKKSVTIKGKEFEKEIDSIPTAELDFNGFKIELIHSGFKDSIMFYNGGKVFFLEVSTNKWNKKNWTWDFLERDGRSFFSMPYHYKNNRPQFISIQNDRQKHGVTLHTGFNNNKKISSVEPYFIELVEDEGKRIFKPSLPEPYYYFSYNRFGKLKTKKVTGVIRYCECK
jgi:hypothetical protein